MLPCFSSWQHPRVPAAKIENLAIALTFVRAQGVRLENIGASDLADGKKNLVAILHFSFLFRFLPLFMPLFLLWLWLLCNERIAVDSADEKINLLFLCVHFHCFDDVCGVLQVLGLIWTLILRWEIQRGGEQKDDLLTWCVCMRL